MDRCADDAVTITGDTDAWFAALDAGDFAQQWALTEQAIVAETERAHVDLHRETLGAMSQHTPTHAALDASES